MASTHVYTKSRPGGINDNVSRKRYRKQGGSMKKKKKTLPKQQIMSVDYQAFLDSAYNASVQKEFFRL